MTDSVRWNIEFKLSPLKVWQTSNVLSRKMNSCQFYIPSNAYIGGFNPKKKKKPYYIRYNKYKIYLNFAYNHNN